MIGTIIGTFLQAFPTKLLDRYLDYLSQKTTTEAEIAMVKIQSELAIRKELAEIVKVEQGWWVTAMIRPLFAYPLAFYFGKIAVWDSALGLGSSSALDGPVGEWAGWIVAAYFLSRPVEKVARGFIHTKKATSK